MYFVTHTKKKRPNVLCILLQERYANGNYAVSKYAMFPVKKYTKMSTNDVPCYRNITQIPTNDESKYAVYPVTRTIRKYKLAMFAVRETACKYD